jgi:hypothetical protein
MSTFGGKAGVRKIVRLEQEADIGDPMVHGARRAKKAGAPAWRTTYTLESLRRVARNA